ncbi:hypothetical protein [Halosolutus gelatinilyticus]|uniref:hypothetical protein n=1 Tax=Halosolutus gelatinilyticus TaxID=2931975 RepID=UPI001FF122E8|nr:hypothetical protein [Halosolutus gelatinilyticus]
MTLIGENARLVFAQGVAVVLAALLLNCVKGMVFDTGDTYARVLGEFASKRETAAILIVSMFAGPYVAGLLQEWLVAFLLRPGYLEIGAGLGLWALIHLTNRQVKSWKPFNEGDPLFVVMAVLGFVLIFSGLAYIG